MEAFEWPRLPPTAAARWDTFEHDAHARGALTCHALVDNHAFVSKLEVFVPCADVASVLHPEPMPSTAAAAAAGGTAAPQHESFFYRVRLPPAAFLAPPLLDAVRRGEVRAVSVGVASDHSNSLGLLPQGVLLLSVDRETYQQLGLEGVPSPFEARQKKKDVQQYRVSVDLRAPSFRAGKALHDRVQQYAAALSALDLLVSFHVDGISQPLAFPEGADARLIRALPSARPVVPTVVPAALAAAQGCTWEEEDCEAALDWFGQMAWRSELGPATEEAKAGGSEERDEGSRPVDVGALRWQGLLSPHLVRRALHDARAAVSAGRAPWAVVLAWGFADALESWGAPHGFDQAGENDLAVLVLPGDRFALFALAGALDRGLTDRRDTKH